MTPHQHTSTASLNTNTPFSGFFAVAARDFGDEKWRSWKPFFEVHTRPGGLADYHPEG
ncbi:hypothetical protein E2C01_080791 [Portunus trituberculatus]|uniref:Uncharacterized protein n=1 Tax=Portunus trituberculatus TaxID=210409 RepID=A0A5B7IQA0_PORTR|nr:hypothetical protein [Portunus trituberculatus]